MHEECSKTRFKSPQSPRGMCGPFLTNAQLDYAARQPALVWRGEHRTERGEGAAHSPKTLRRIRGLEPAAQRCERCKTCPAFRELEECPQHFWKPCVPFEECCKVRKTCALPEDCRKLLRFVRTMRPRSVTEWSRTKPEPSEIRCLQLATQKIKHGKFNASSITHRTLLRRRIHRCKQARASSPPASLASWALRADTPGSLWLRVHALQIYIQFQCKSISNSKKMCIQQQNA